MGEGEEGSKEQEVSQTPQDNLGTIGAQPENMWGTDLGPLHIGNSCATGSSYGTPKVGAGAL